MAKNPYLSDRQKKLLKTISECRELTFKQLSERSGVNLSDTQWDTGRPSLNGAGVASLEFHGYVRCVESDVNNRNLVIIKVTKTGIDRASRLK